jgi:hypothetical protein
MLISFDSEIPLRGPANDAVKGKETSLPQQAEEVLVTEAVREGAPE